MYQSLPTNGDGYLWVRLLALEEPLNEEEPLRCCLEPFKLHTSTSDLHKFKALSYVWGFSLYQSSIICNGEATNISSNLYDGLFAIWRRTPDAWVWADALCINQRDREETSIQVRNMDLIYSTAVQTCIWLGRLSDPEQTKQVFELSDRHHASFAKRIGPQTPFAMMTLTQGYEMTHNWVERTLGADGPRKVFDVVDQLVAHPWRPSSIKFRILPQEIAFEAMCKPTTCSMIVRSDIFHPPLIPKQAYTYLDDPGIYSRSGYPSIFWSFGDGLGQAMGCHRRLAAGDASHIASWT
ncbi:hypothetical protein EV356DRAFT_502608 [Viridothelium virens]|uniref:Heterokaryon incompatibility domain-containing protein n=1 Tax=Viridothelium virens TaxID=1048519 RepID=A0A6A6H8I4_VIRVR|nr:hypothetical protein EV356DRAFT_502608 [Viridothelium virens]